MTLSPVPGCVPVTTDLTIKPSRSEEALRGAGRRVMERAHSTVVVLRGGGS